MLLQPARRSLLAAAVIAGLWLEACSPGLGPVAPPAARHGGELKLIYQTPPETLDPQAIVFLLDAEIASLIYEGLVGHGDRSGDVRPLLAESWEQSEGGQLWTFTLRQDAWFHDDPCFPDGRGRRLTAADVRYTFERIAQPGTEWANWYLFADKVEGISDFKARRATTIRGVEVLDERRVRIRLTRPYASFLKVLASQTAFIVPREAVSAYGEGFGRRPVGTGPFRLARWKPMEQVLLVRHSRYWRGGEDGARLPYLEGLDIRFRADATEAGLAAAFLKGETHMFTAQSKLLDTLMQDEPGRRARFKVAGVQPSLSVRFLGFALDNDSPLARHPDLRRAFAMALDRSSLGRAGTYTPAPPAESLVPPALLGRSLSWHAHSPQRAAELLAPHLNELAAHPPVVANNFASDEITQLQQGLKSLSVPIRVLVRPAGYYGYIVKQRPDIFRVSFTPSFVDPEDYYCLFYSKSSPEVNLTAYRNPEYDRVLEAAMAEMNAARRAQRFLRLEEILRQDVPALYLSHGAPMQVAVAPQLNGVVVRLSFADYSAAWLGSTEARNNASQSAR